MNLDHKNTTIFYTHHGKGDAVVLLHGFLENSNIWEPFVAELSKNNRIICIDLLGHGKTGCLGKIHTMELMAECVHIVLKQLKIYKAIFIGHSMGAYVGLAFAEIKPECVTRLCLVNSTAEADSIEKQKNRERAIEAVKHYPETFIRMGISNLFQSKNRVVFSNDIKRITNEALQMSSQAIIASLEGMKIRKDRTHILKNSRFKQMMIIGKKDPVLNYDRLIQQTNNTAVKIIEFPDGHMSYIENKPIFLHTLVHFIENK